MTIVTVWFLFLAVVAIIGAAGFQLSKYGDVVATKSGLGGTWVGTALLAAITSLPELATGLSSIRAVGAPDLAVGDILGSCVFNLVILAVLDFLATRKKLYTVAAKGHRITAGFGLAMIAFSGINIWLAPELAKFSVGHMGYYTFVFFVLYAYAMRTIFLHEKEMATEDVDELNPSNVPLRKAIGMFLFFGAFVVGAGIALPFLGEQIVHLMGWEQAFVGTMFLAFATSLPEIATTLSAFKLGAINMAIGNLLGSNIFNILVLGIDDIALTSGTLFTAVKPIHAISALIAVLMTSTVLFGIHSRPKKRIFGLMTIVGFLLAGLYIANAAILLLRIELLPTN